MPKTRDIRVIHVRWGADAPPLPLGCRWCGHPPYAHDASSLPHRRHHQWEQPTLAQMRRRLDARRRAGLCASLPPVAAVRPLIAEPPATARRGRHARPGPATTQYERHFLGTAGGGRREPYQRGSDPSKHLSPELYRSEPYRRGAAA
ncbi:hypothetical protein DQ384_39775 [Sphaerisporangium album]|uniref:Uncharacterized protein n=1 Tax=Sphaerisporangium album TaxID=509200 RepID=A0A367EJ70_9ACTN|nr:hypothetical protein DQ384_39775 [Sphaerisporangium album]